MTAYYFDENVARQIADGLRSRGIDVITAEEDGHRRTPDPIVMDRAFQLGRVLFSHDLDMVSIANQRIQDGELFIGLVYARQPASIGRCVTDLELVVHVMSEDEMRLQVVHIPI